jgi:hypothetical protein
MLTTPTLRRCGRPGGFDSHFTESAFWGHAMNERWEATEQRIRAIERKIVVEAEAAAAAGEITPLDLDLLKINFPELPWAAPFPPATTRP